MINATSHNPDNDSHSARPTLKVPIRLSETVGSNGQAPPKRRLRWEWNIPLLLTSLAISALAIFGFTGLYFWQSSRIANELLSRASQAEVDGETKEQIKWLTRYMGLVPNDAENLSRLALAADATVSVAAGDVEFARRHLSRALAACGEGAAYSDKRQQLREKLIPRLLELGRGTEAEKQILAMERVDKEDRQALKWLANALVLQRGDSEYLDRDPDQYDPSEDYWNWLASQATGEVLRLAVEANPDDVELASSLLAACFEHPGWFANVGQSIAHTEIDELADRSLKKLAGTKQDGRAQLTAYFFTARTDAVEAKRLLAEAVEPALARLARPSPASSTGTQAEYQPLWDWRIALEAARFSNEATAESIFARLIELDNEEIALEQREAAYWGLAGMQFEKTEYAAAVATAKSGLTKVSESLKLNNLLAKASHALENWDEARHAIHEIVRIANMRLQRLDGPQGANLRNSDKANTRKLLALDLWETQVLQGRLALAEKDNARATQELGEAFKSTLLIPDENRVLAGKLLSEAYARQNLWDLAGQTLDQCLSLAPNESTLRVAAADAWRKAGATDRATEQLTKLDDGSFASAVEIAQLTALAQASKPLNQRDMKSVQEAIQVARQRLDAATVEERSLMNPWQLELLELSVESTGTASASRPAESNLSRLEEIVLQYADVSPVQMFAVANFAAAGRFTSAEGAIARLEAVANRTQASADLANVAIAKSNIWFIQGNIDGALQILESGMQSIPEQKVVLAKTAANIALRSERSEAAYKILSSIPEEELDIDALMMLAGIINLPLDGKPNETAIRLENLEHWTKRLKQTEGANGTHWRYLAAEQLIAKAASVSDPTPLLDEASKLFNEIDAIRPRWGRAAALGGRIASLKGRSEDAIRLLKRAMRDGDQQVTTVLVLVRELIASNRLEQAATEIEKISNLADSVLPISAMAFSLAQKKGDFTQALALTQQLTTGKPLEVESWLLRAQTAVAARASNGITEDEKARLNDDAWSSLEKAHELSEGKSLTVWDARFRFKAQADDKTAAQEILAELQRSALPDEVRFLAAGRGFLTLKEFGSARECFQNCLLLNPGSADAYLGLADLNTAIGDNSATLEALRKAHQASPTNTKIGERLALNLAFAKSDSIDWQEIDGLLASSATPDTPRSRMVTAMIGLGRGNEERRAKALQSLLEIAGLPDSEGLDAKRILASYHAAEWSKNSQKQSEKAIENFKEANRLYEELYREPGANLLDLARYADLLLKGSRTEKDAGYPDIAQTQLAAAERVIKKLESSSGSSIASLQLRIRLAQALGKEAEIEQIAANWVLQAGSLESLGMQMVWEIAGRSLMENGFPELALAWFEKVHQQDPRKYRLLTESLAKAKQYDRAIELCNQEYKVRPSPEAAALLAEIAMSRSGVALPAEAEQSLKEAMANFPESPVLLESVATMLLVQQRYLEAVNLLESSERLAPKSVRTLNNLAMALSELPMRKQEALAKIERAIELGGRIPELLDTMGWIQLRLGNLEEAERTLQEACSRSDDIKFKIHLSQVLLEKKNPEGAGLQWAKISQANLDEIVLSADEQATLKQLRSLFEVNL